MNKTIVYYFTGSGNTLKVAQRVKETFLSHGMSCELIAMEDAEELVFDDVTYIGLLFPVAVQSTFPNVWAFIEGLPKTSGQKIFMMDTMVYYSGGIVGPVKKVLKRKGYQCVGAKELKMSSSMDTKGHDEKAVIKNKLALQEAETFVMDLLSHKTTWHRVPVLSDALRGVARIKGIWKSMSRKKIIDNQLCVDCQVCVKRCPVNALASIDGAIKIDHDRCVSCMRCVHVCPKDAFLLSGKKVQRL